MLYIRKDPPSPEVAQEISRVERDAQWKKNAQPDAAHARMTFDRLDKSIIRKQLIREQHGLCAYCMRRINDDNNTTNTVIEHWMPIEADSSQALDYSNMMACCDGGRRNDDASRVLHCDASKGNRVIAISPYKQEQMDKIRYGKDGRIYTDPEDKELEKDLEILCLNEAPNLMYGRKQVYENFARFVSGLAKKGKSINMALKKELEVISNADEYREYAGVWLFFLRRRLGLLPVS